MLTIFIFLKSISLLCISPYRDEFEEKEEKHQFYDNLAADVEANEETKQTSF